jgi:hypothetical protein
MPSLVRNSRLQQISMRPSAAGTLSRLACAHAVSAGIDVAPLMVKAGVTRKPELRTAAALQPHSPGSLSATTGLFIGLFGSV